MYSGTSNPLVPSSSPSPSASPFTSVSTATAKADRCMSTAPAQGCNLNNNNRGCTDDPPSQVAQMHNLALREMLLKYEKENHQLYERLYSMECQLHTMYRINLQHQNAPPDPVVHNECVSLSAHKELLAQLDESRLEVETLRQEKSKLQARYNSATGRVSKDISRACENH